MSRINSSTVQEEMACNVVNIGGHEHMFAEEPPVALKCLICLLVVKDPQQHGKCGKLFCNTCITEHRRTKTECPYCRQELADSIFVDNRSAQEVRTLKVKCKNTGKGCRWENELRYLEDHQHKCGHTLVPCTNKCKSRANGNDFETMVLVKDFELHLVTQCPRREYPCPHCKQMGEYWEQTTVHLETCQKIRVHCPNSPLCRVKIPRCEIADHLTVCKYQRELCKYQEYGCTAMNIHKEIKKHEEDVQLHFPMLSRAVVTMKDEISTLKREVRQLKARDKFVFKFTEFEKHKREEITFDSPPFFSHKNGYKMCVRVYPNGLSQAKRTHVSVFLYLQKGPFDDYLMWPFSGNGDIEVLNQLDDTKHQLTTVAFPEEAGQRVIETERHSSGCGKFHFINFTDLDYNPGLNRQFLKDDCLVFRVAMVLSDYKMKPWLQCTIRSDSNLEP